LPPQEREEPGLLVPGRKARLLAQGAIQVIGALPYSSNHTFLVRLELDGDEALAVYKPASGERPLWDFPASSLHRREVAAYEVSRALGWDLVPLTVSRADAPLGPGSLQEFVEHDPEQHYFTLLEGRPEVFRRLALFDVICNNADRKSGHCLLDAHGRVWAVDHGLTFHEEPKLRTVIWDFAGEQPAESDLLAARDLGALLHGKTGGPRLAGLISKPELRALQARVSALGPGWVFPQPESAWSFPWPLV
jgi:hypothetical protein